MDALKSNLQNLQPFATRTTQLLKQQFGQAPEITQLPSEYQDLEAETDKLKNAVTALLNVTKTFESESYDYPANIKESLTGFGKSVGDKFREIANAQNAHELQQIVLNKQKSADQGKASPDSSSPASAGNGVSSANGAQAPRTLYHALSRAAMAATEILGTQAELGTELSHFAITQMSLGDARLKQDRSIDSGFNEYLRNFVNGQLHDTQKARKKVHNARLLLDAAKTSAKNAKPEKAEAARAEFERCEDSFVAAVEESSRAMKSALEDNVIAEKLKAFYAAELEYHKKAVEALEATLK